jgi:RNA polymerase sigma-70 factor (ECF subfamily)
MGVQTLPGTVYGQAEPFDATHWSVVLAAGKSQVNPEASRSALAKLCETYWPPLYAFLRARGHSSHDAQDLTQGFFAYLIERKIYTRADRQKGKFRSFLLASLKNFLLDARDREKALKRGGGHQFVPLDEAQTEAAESLLKDHATPGHCAIGEDKLFERSWAETLVGATLDRVATAYKTEGKESVFQELRTFLTIGAAPLPTYAELAVRLGMTEPTLRSRVARLRSRYREVLRSEVRKTVETEAEVDGELRELLRVLTDMQTIEVPS